MEVIRDHFLDAFKNRTGLISLMAITNPYRYNPLIDGLDLLLLIISESVDPVHSLDHIRFGGERVQIRTVDPASLESWIAGGENRSIIHWLVRGDILLDRDEYLARIRQHLISFPDSMREQRMIVEFSSFLRTYLQAKQDLQDGNILDAHSSILASLNHWAHIALIEEGIHPELTVWSQMKRYNPGIYKLYEELTVSPETLEQRVQLVLLACEFSVMNKMKACCALLFDILARREEPWSIVELNSHASLSGLHVDLSLMVQKLVRRGYIREVAVIPASGDTDALELKYAPLPEDTVIN
jgi:hypothetical protein